MAAHSFKPESLTLNERPRTPESISRLIEPIPETIAHLLKADSLRRRPTTSTRAAPRNRSDKRTNKPSAPRANKHSHSHSASWSIPPASPIDALASAASSVFEATTKSPPTFHNLYQSQYPFERSSKRARSEFLGSPQQPATSPLFSHESSHRPATSYNVNNSWSYNVEQGISQGQRMRSFSSHTRATSMNGTPIYPEPKVDEAELLLNFSRGGNTSSLFGLGIRAQGDGAQGVQKPPALPPFPYAAGQQNTSSGKTTGKNPLPPTEDAQLGQSSGKGTLLNTKSPPTNESSGQVGISVTETLNDNPPKIKPTITNATSTEPQVQEQDEVADVMDIDHSSDNPGDTTETSGTNEDGHRPMSRAKQPETPSIPLHQDETTDIHSESEGMRLPDSDQERPSKRVKLDPGMTSASLLGEYAQSETTEFTRVSEAQPKFAVSTKFQERGVVCPSCQFAADSMSEQVDWLQCDGCDTWYHAACAGISAKQSEQIDKYYCEACVPKFGKTTMKRKSTRTRTTVDYAGLNEGVLRPPDQTRDHHYIQSFKNGDLDLTPETFLRLPGNMVTLDFFEKSHGFVEPVLIPNSLNPRPPFPGTIPLSTHKAGDDSVIVPDDGQDDMDMVIPQELTVRRVAQHYGGKNQIPVIDVKAQESSKGWTVDKWVDYYEKPGDKPVHNVISLECSGTPLCRLIRRPKVVRDLDLQDSVWPDTEWRKSVGFYVLMSVADCYTDFHIDFGGSSVYYHILKGKKVFFFIPPTPSNLQKYQDWNDMPSQQWTWLPDQTKTKECYRVDLYPGDTMLIPAGWIHAVWTPEDSLVIGGNFLTRLHYGMQFRVAEVEKANNTPIAFKYPKFQKVMWYTVLQYLEQDPLPGDVRDIFLDGKQFLRDTPIWCEFDKFGENSKGGVENFNARYYSKQELDGLPDLVSYIFRTVLIYLDRLDGISAKTRKAVMDSIPKGRGEPLDLARDFAIWVAWKRGNEDIPEWVHPGALLPTKPEEPAEKKLSDAQMKKLQRASAIPAPERQSARLRNVAETAMQQQEQLAQSSTPKTSSLGPRRTACDACRRRKMRCKHVESASHNASPIIFTSPMEPSPQANFMGVVVPDREAAAPPPPPPSFPPPFQVDPVAPMSNGIEIQGFSPGPKHEITELKKGRTKACYECRRSKRRCIHDEFGKVDPIKQREPAVPRGSGKRKSGPSPEMPLAKKPVGEQVAPIAPMLAGQVNTFEAVPPSTTWTNGSAKQDGMFRNSTVNDFSSMTGVVNINPLSSRTSQPQNRPPSTAPSNGQQRSPPRPPPSNDWVLDPALMGEDYMPPPNAGHEQTADNYADAQDAMLAFSQYNAGPPASSQESANQFLNFVDYEAGQPRADMDIDPLLQQSIVGLGAALAQEEAEARAREQSQVDEGRHSHNGEAMDVDTPRQQEPTPQPMTNGTHSQPSATAEDALDPALMLVIDQQTNGDVLPSTEDHELQHLPSREVISDNQETPGASHSTPVKQRKTSVPPQTPPSSGLVQSLSPVVSRSGGRQRSVKLENGTAIEETDQATKKLIEQMRAEDLQSRGLRRRS